MKSRQIEHWTPLFGEAELSAEKPFAAQHNVSNMISFHYVNYDTSKEVGRNNCVAVFKYKLKNKQS